MSRQWSRPDLKATPCIHSTQAPIFRPETPHAIAEKLHDEVMKALALPAVRERLAAVNVDPMPMTLAEFGSFFKKDVAANLELVKAANIPRQ